MKIVKIGHPGLRRTNPFVPETGLKDPRFKKIIRDMVATMRKADGVGLAANQVALEPSIIVMECKKNKRYPKAPSFPLQIYFNPKILSMSEEREFDWEGCLSIPGYRGFVPRSTSLVFEAMTPKGKTVRRKISGFEARVMQHEVDHVNGFFYMDRMPDLRRWFHSDELRRLAQ